MTASALSRRSGPRDPGRLVLPALICVGLIGFCLLVAVRFPQPSVQSMAILVGFGGVAGWMFLSERYRLTLAVLLLYLGLLDGFLKLRTGYLYATVGRDVLLYAIVAGALARAALRKETLRLPPLSGWVLGWVLLALACVFNPGSFPLPHALAGVRQHVEFVPLFFFGYLVMRSEHSLRVLLALLLVCGAANGVVSTIQYNLTPEQLASWGPGYEKFVNGDEGGLAGRTFAGAGGESRVRPFGLGGDAGGGGVIAVLAIPAAIAFFLSVRKRRGYAAMALVLAGGLVLAVVTSQGRGVVVAAFIAVFAFVSMSVTARRLVPMLAGIGVAAVIAVFVVSSVADGGGKGAFSRYDSIAPTKLLSTTKSDRGGALSVVPGYIADYPFGHGLASGGPATGFFRGNAADATLSAESEFSFLVIEMGVLGLVVMVGFTLRLCLLALRRVRQERDPERRALLAAVFSPLFALLGLYIGGPATAGAPLGPYLWFSAGLVSFWLVERRRPRFEAVAVPTLAVREPIVRAAPVALGVSGTRDTDSPSERPIEPPAERAPQPPAAAPPPASAEGRHIAPPAPAQSATEPLVAVTYGGQSRGGVDGILAYSHMLTGALRATPGLDATLVVGAPGGWAVAGERIEPNLPAVGRGVDGVFLQYNPFSYGSRGYAPWLVKELRQLKAEGVPIAVMVHEAYLTPLRPRQRVVASWQRHQLRGVLATVDVAFGATQKLCETVGDTAPNLSVHHLPVSSNLPDRREERAAMRQRLGAGEDDLVLVAFGTGHPSQLQSWVGAAARAAQPVAPRTFLLNLGAGAPPVPDVPAEIDVLSPGRLTEDQLAAWLSAGDLFLAPFSDGVTTRRTTVMAALQHGLPVITTLGPDTGSRLRVTEAMRLVDSERPAEMDLAVRALAADPEARRALGAAGRELFEREYDWRVLGRRIAEVFKPPRRSRDRPRG
jgi:glycosyltransferase involved in cell wall biosynthesis